MGEKDGRIGSEALRVLLAILLLAFPSAAPAGVENGDFERIGGWLFPREDSARQSFLDAVSRLQEGSSANSPVCD
jgi:hypothetical protein